MIAQQMTDNSLTSTDPLELTSLKKLWRLSFPLMLSMLSASLLNFCDRFFLSHFSLHSLEACATAGELCSFFQLPLIYLTSTIQVFIGQSLGSKQSNQIGSYIWQMIWVSLISMIITAPSCSLVNWLLLKDSIIQNEASTYFYCLSGVNFLFPIGAALNAFFIGTGRTQVTIFVTICAHSINILLDILLIFGFFCIPPLGILGSAIATSVAQLAYCLIFFLIFLNKRNHFIYKSHSKKIDLQKLKKFFVVAFPSATGKLTLMFAWIILTGLIVRKGGDYLLVNSVGISLLTVFACFQDGLGQATLSQSSYLVGAQKKKSLWNLWKTTFIFHAIMQLVFALPLLIFPEAILAFFLKEPVQIEMLEKCCYWIWVFLFFDGVNRLAQSFLTSLKDTSFIMYNKIITVWITAIIPTCCAMFVWDLPAQYLWALTAMDCFIAAAIFTWRTARKILSFTAL